MTNLIFRTIPLAIMVSAGGCALFCDHLTIYSEKRITRSFSVTICYLKLCKDRSASVQMLKKELIATQIPGIEECNFDEVGYQDTEGRQAIFSIRCKEEIDLGNANKGYYPSSGEPTYHNVVRRGISCSE